MYVGEIINGLMVLVTISIALIAWRTFKSQTRPKIIVYVHHDHLRRGALIIRIHNIGKDVATDISLNLEKPIPEIKRPLLTNIPSLPPGEYREYFWGTAKMLMEKTTGETYNIKYHYHHDGKVMCGEDVIETDSFDNDLTRLSPYQDIVKAIENSSRSLEFKLTNVLIEVSEIGDQWKKFINSKDEE